jgi:hypothetical protein
VAAARLHDLHHLATNYKTDWPGEAEISAWEIAGGCGHYYAAWILDLGGWGAGLIVAPRRLFRAFMRGRQAKTNLYQIGFDEKHLDQGTVGGLRDQLGLHMSPTPPTVARRCVVQLLVSARHWFVAPVAPFRARAFLADRSRMLVVKSQPQYL